MRTLFKVAISISGLAVIAAPGFGQGIRPMDLSSAGTGLVHVNGHDATVSSVHVTLAAGGNATIVIRRPGPDVTMRGKWRGAGRDIHVDITGVQAGSNREFDRAAADGTIVLDKDGDPRTIKIKGTDLEDKNNIFLNFKSTDSDHRAQRMDHDQSDRTSFGRYTDMENWSHNGQTFSLKYTLQLDRDSGQAKLVISPQGDRNEPDDRLDVGEHGQVLDYLHTGQDVTQTGHWWQQGDRIEIRFDHISYGDTNRAKSERLIGHLKGTTIFITELDRAFYGQDAKLSFEKG